MKQAVLPLFALLISFFAQGSEGLDTENMEPSPDSIQRIKKIKVKSISDLTQLSPFKDVAVIQRRYLPKTFRGEAGLFLNGLLNNRFFYSGGAAANLSFFIRERYGIGVSGMAFGRLQRAVTRDLKNINQIAAFTQVNPYYYAGGCFKWNPIYGKFSFSFLETRIIYFDMFFLLGGGIVYLKKGTDQETQRRIDAGGLDEEKLHKDIHKAPVKPVWPAGSWGFGHTFAVNKSWAAGWNLQWIIYPYKLIDTKTKIEAPGYKWNTDIHFSVGVNYYFPGAKYR